MTLSLSTAADLKENTMKLHLLSDLHLEFLRDYDTKTYVQQADVLVLAGDIHVGAKNTSEALSRFAQHYEHVLFVPGNHEYYRTSIEEFHANLVLPANVHLLNPDKVEINGVTFAGATLWTNFREDPIAAIVAKRAISDFRAILDFSPLKARDLYQEHYDFLKSNPADVVITHFLPTPECVHPKYHRQGAINYYFANDIQDIHPKLWLFGHTHDHMDFHNKGTRFLAVPSGYPSDYNTKNGIILTLESA